MAPRKTKANTKVKAVVKEIEEEEEEEEEEEDDDDDDDDDEEEESPDEEEGSSSSEGEEEEDDEISAPPPPKRGRKQTKLPKLPPGVKPARAASAAAAKAKSKATANQKGKKSVKGVAATTSADSGSSSGTDSSAADIATVRSIFTDAQKTSAAHSRCIHSLQHLLVDKQPALDEFFTCLSRLLLIFKKEPSVDRLVNFIAKLCATKGPAVVGQGGNAQRTLAAPVLEYLIDKASAEDKAVRFRVCQLVATILDHLTNDDLDFSDDLWDALVEKLLPRLRDKIPVVRVQAILALKRLQDAEDGKDDPITAELCRAMKSDSSKDVRRSALQHVLVSQSTLADIIRRTRDVKDDVRCAAFEVLGEKVDIAYLTVPQRVALVEWGLSDRSEKVSAAARTMICVRWLKSAGGNPFKLLDKLEVMEFEDAAAKALEAILGAGLRAEMSRGNPNAMDIIGAGEEDAKMLRAALAQKSVFEAGLTKEAALFVRVKAEFIKKDEKKLLTATQRDDILEEMLPDTPSFCLFIEALAGCEGLEERPVDVFITQQMLKLAKLVDFSEEAGRREMTSVLNKLLGSAETPADLVEPALRALAAASPSEADFIRVVVQMINDIVDPIEGEQGADSGGGGGGSGALDEEDADEEAVERRVYQQIRCLEMMGLLLEQTSRTLADAVLATLECSILQAVQSPYPIVREMGVQCLGRWTMLGQDQAVAHKALFVGIADNDEEELAVRGVAVQALLDLALIFGDAVAGKSGSVEEEERGANTLTGLLLRLAAADEAVHPGLAAVAAEGCAKLLFAGRLKEPKLLSRLLALYFTPGSPADPLILAKLLKEEEQDEDEERRAGGVGEGGTTGGDKPDAEAFRGVEGFETLTEMYNSTSYGSPVRLNQVLTCFFPAFAVAGLVHQRTLRAALPILVRSMSSSYTEHEEEAVPIDKVVKLLVFLLSQKSIDDKGSAEAPALPAVTAEKDKDGDVDVSEGEEEADEAVKAKVSALGLPTDSTSAALYDAGVGHVTMCMCYELLNCISDTTKYGFTADLCKVLSSLLPPETDQEMVKLLKELVARALKMCRDKTTQKYLVKYASLLQMADRTPTKLLSDEKWKERTSVLGDNVARVEDEDDSDAENSGSGAGMEDSDSSGGGGGGGGGKRVPLRGKKRKAASSPVAKAIGRPTRTSRRGNGSNGTTGKSKYIEESSSEEEEEEEEDKESEDEQQEEEEEVDQQEDEDEDDELEDEQEVKKNGKSFKCINTGGEKGKTKTPTTVEEGREVESDKAGKKSTPAGKGRRKSTPKTPALVEDEEDEDNEKMVNGKGKAGKKSTPAAKGKGRGKKLTSIVSEEEDATENGTISKKATPAVKGAGKGKPKVLAAEDEETNCQGEEKDDEDEEEEESGKAVKKGRKSGRGGTPAKGSKKARTSRSRKG